MKRYVVCLYIVALLLAFVAIDLHGQNYDSTTGTILPCDAKPFDFEEFVDYSNILIEGEYNGQPISIALKDLKELSILSITYKNTFHNRYRFLIRVIGRASGRELVVENGTFRSASEGDLFMLKYKALNPINMALTTRDIYLYATIEEKVPLTITFGEKIGNLKTCLVKHETGIQLYFPPTYLYCPYHGKKLEWSSPETKE